MDAAHSRRGRISKKVVRRTTAACYRCHSRKVRCDAAIYGTCTNCRLDGHTDCVIRPNDALRNKTKSGAGVGAGVGAAAAALLASSEARLAAAPAALPQTQPGLVAMGRLSPPSPAASDATTMSSAASIVSTSSASTAASSSPASSITPSSIGSTAPTAAAAAAAATTSSPSTAAPGQKRIRRAAAACFSCHRRKVRCDGAILGYPCTNCRLDGKGDCMLRPNDSSRYKNLALKTLALTENDAQTPPAPVAVADEPAVRPAFPLIGATPPPRAELGFLDMESLAFLAPDVQHVLAANGCLDVPTPELVHLFATRYFTYIHPCLPIIDEVQFWNVLVRDQSFAPLKMSLFVFHAMLLVTCPFMPLDAIQACGHVDRQDARRKLYSRAKALYDMRIESNPLAVAQGTLLLSFHTTEAEPLATTSWLHSAVEHAAAFEARSVALSPELNHSCRRRLWWSIITRDRTLCLSRHQTPRELPFDIASLPPLSEDDFSDEIAHSRIHSPATRRHLVDVFQAQCRMAVIVGDIVSLTYSPASLETPSIDGFSTGMARIHALRASLCDAQFEPWLREQIAVADAAEPVAHFSRLSLIYFYSACVALANHEALLVEHYPELVQPSRGEALARIGSDLAYAVTQTTATIEAWWHARTAALPATGVECLPLAVLAHAAMPLILAAIDVKLSPSRAEMAERKRKLDFYASVVDAARKAYDVTELFSVCTNQILQLAYTMTKELYLSCPTADMPSSTHQLFGLDGNTGLDGGAGPFSRPTTWLESFLQHPVAYLQISTCVDYWLANARLPQENFAHLPIRRACASSSSSSSSSQQPKPKSQPKAPAAVPVQLPLTPPMHPMASASSPPAAAAPPLPMLCTDLASSPPALHLDVHFDDFDAKRNPGKGQAQQLLTPDSAGPLPIDMLFDQAYGGGTTDAAPWPFDSTTAVDVREDLSPLTLDFCDDAKLSPLDDSTVEPASASAVAGAGAGVSEPAAVNGLPSCVAADFFDFDAFEACHELPELADLSTVPVVGGV